LKQEALDEPFAFIANLKNVCCIYFWERYILFTNIDIEKQV
jgi:hypothetical protein